jgi:hypothetical protein
VSLGTGIGKRSTAECALLGDQLSRRQQQLPNIEAAMHRAIMPLARAHPIDTVHPVHVTLYTVRTAVTNPSNVQHASARYPPR